MKEATTRGRKRSTKLKSIIYPRCLRSIEHPEENVKYAGLQKEKPLYLSRKGASFLVTSQEQPCRR